MKDTCLVVPTIRDNCLQLFLKQWGSIGLFDHVDLIVMEDNQKRTFETLDSGAVEHLCWDDIEDDLKERSWIIPRRSDTVRSYAYYRAWALGYEYIMTLDDDCYPPGPADGLQFDGRGFVGDHKKWLNSRSRWFNTLNDVTPRGVPYFNRGKNMNVVLNHGLWTNVLDYDAPHQLVNPIAERYTFDNKLVPKGLYFPMCGMNLMWKRDVTVLLYHLLMGQLSQHYSSGKVLEKLPFDRFGDIWCGIIMKKICDAHGLSVASGMPYIRHDRASDPFKNLRKEANGIEVNEHFWEHVDAIVIEDSRSLWESYSCIGAHVSEFTALHPKYKEHRHYFEMLGQAMILWSELFKGDNITDA